mmetsp:Transcript_37828/g.76484  ORF Transcript_37828/g.76484 Transcript_37828/m.76484 type:complete len:197 (-) Transcript_37828:360-950(-)
MYIVSRFNILIALFLVGGTSAWASPRRPMSRALSSTSTINKAAVYDHSSDSVKRADALFRDDSRPIILFDGVCNMCNGGVNFALDWDPEGNFRFAALQSSAGRALLRRAGRRPDDISSIVLVEKDRAYVKSNAVLRIAQKLSNPFPFLGLFGFVLPGFGRDFVYDQVANNRYNLFGKSNSCRVSDERFDSRFIADI